MGGLLQSPGSNGALNPNFLASASAALRLLTPAVQVGWESEAAAAQTATNRHFDKSQPS